MEGVFRDCTYELSQALWSDNTNNDNQAIDIDKHKSQRRDISFCHSLNLTMGDSAVVIDLQDSDDEVEFVASRPNARVLTARPSHIDHATWILIQQMQDADDQVQVSSTRKKKRPRSANHDRPKG